jgi:holin-like protein
MKLDQSLILGLLTLLTFQFVGEALRVLTRVPIPGPVLGMVLFLGFLQVRRPSEHSAVVRTADGLLRHMQLFFVPPGVGVLTHLALLRAEWPAALGGFLASWVAALVVTALTAISILSWQRRRTKAPAR